MKTIASIEITVYPDIMARDMRRDLEVAQTYLVASTATAEQIAAVGVEGFTMWNGLTKAVCVMAQAALIAEGTDQPHQVDRFRTLQNEAAAVMKLYQDRFNLSLYVAEDPANKDRLVIMSHSNGKSEPVAEFTPPPNRGGGNKKFTPDQVREIRSHFADLEARDPEYARMKEYSDIAKMYDVTWWAVYDIVNGRTYKSVE